MPTGYKNKKGVNYLFYKLCYKGVWLPVIVPYDRKETPINCTHENTERKNRGVVCLDCSEFLPYAKSKTDKTLDKKYIDLI